MNHRVYSVPVSFSLLLHAFIVFLLFFSLTLDHKPLETPPYIRAELVKLNSEAKQSKPLFEKASEPVPELQKPVEPEQEIEREEVERQKQEKTRQEKLKQEKILQEKKKKEKELAEKKKREEAERLRRDQRAKEQAEQEKVEKERIEKERALAEKRKAEEALAKAVAEEEAYRQSLMDQETVQSYADLIRQRVEQHWNRPPSAKKGMEVELEIQLVPTGYVVSVSVIKGSGNPAFDLSAQQAVQKAARFPELKDMPPRVFEKHFRRFKMLFRVEDHF